MVVRSLTATVRVVVVLCRMALVPHYVPSTPAQSATTTDIVAWRLAISIGTRVGGGNLASTLDTIGDVIVYIAQ